MDSAAPEIQIVPLVPGLQLPRRASPRTRSAIPAGYGVQEQCLPFTAASGLGFLIPSPIRFGYCAPNDVPPGCRTFRSPITGSQSDRIFYVADNPDCNFAGNAYALSDTAVDGQVVEPGISFFDRPDQQDLFKIHLPYIWRTTAEIDILFLPLLNRSAQGLEVQSGLVETEWYSNPVNLIVRKPAHPVHFQAGEDVAHALPISRQHRHPSIEIVSGHSRLMRETKKALAEWYRQHATDRGAYKVLARSRQGRIDT